MQLHIMAKCLKWNIQKVHTGLMVWCPHIFGHVVHVVCVKTLANHVPFNKGHTSLCLSISFYLCI